MTNALLNASDIEFGEWLLQFLEVIHGGNPYEIRFIPENGSGYPISVLQAGGDFFIDSAEGKKKSCKVTPESFVQFIATELFLESEGAAVCFTVNSPKFEQMENCKTSDTHIKNGGKINCQFVDIDAPKEMRGDKELLKQWKIYTAKNIINFAVKPSIVVATKNGFHVYWLLENGQHKLFRHIQMQLIQYFGGDPNCVNESRVLRLPNFMHRKDPRNPFPTTVELFEPDLRYTQEYLKNMLPELGVDTLRKVIKGNETSPANELMETIRGSVTELLKSKIAFVKDYGDSLTTHCLMPDHPDRRPSAWIDLRYMWFHCSGCGCHYSINDLAELLDWKDVLAALNKYDLDIFDELNKVKKLLVSVGDFTHLQLSSNEQEKVGKITAKVIEHFTSNHGQRINDKHKQYIHEIIQILLKGWKDKPHLIPLDMGGGKSTIISLFLQEMLIESNETGAIVAVEPKETVKKLKEEINQAVGYEVAYALYGFEENECQLNVKDGERHKLCPAWRNFNCLYKESCRYWQQSKEQKKYPIVIMTLQRMKQDAGRFFEKYGEFVSTIDKKPREMLLIDEKPPMTEVYELKKSDFDTLSHKIIRDLLLAKKNYSGITSVLNVSSSSLR